MDGLSYVLLELIAAGWNVEIQLMVVLNQSVLGVPAERALAIVVSIFIGTVGMMRCSCFNFHRDGWHDAL